VCEEIRRERFVLSLRQEVREEHEDNFFTYMFYLSVSDLVLARVSDGTFTSPLHGKA
jgi:hypothetical protein